MDPRIGHVAWWAQRGGDSTLCYVFIVLTDIGVLHVQEKQTVIAESVQTWLLELQDPSVRYRVLTELIGVSAKDPVVAKTRNAIPISEPVTRLLEGMHPDGYWLQRDPRTLKITGDGVEYGSFATTHFCLSYLAELGLDRNHPKVALAAERYLELQQPDGDWYKHFSCLYGYNIRTFIMLGYQQDKRLQRSINLLLDSIRKDGGYLCDMHETLRSKKKSCIRGSLKALAAFAQLGPQYWEHPSCRALIEYFLGRQGIYKRSQPQIYVNRDVQTMVFPFHWRAGLVEVLYYLARMGHGKDPRLKRTWELLDSKSTSDGRYLLEWTPSQCPWKVGKRGVANKWMTLYTLLSLKAAGMLAE